MTTTHARQFFVNMPVRDLARSRAFFASLGFEFNAKFDGGDAGACMLIGKDSYVMLLPEERFKTFTKQTICDTRTQCEALFTISCESRAAVDEIVKKAVAAGGTSEDDPQDHGFMYDWSFYDLDRHGWGVFWMDPAAAQ